jgi:hypothetical protein
MPFAVGKAAAKPARGPVADWLKAAIVGTLSAANKQVLLK